MGKWSFALQLVLADTCDGAPVTVARRCLGKIVIYTELFLYEDAAGATPADHNSTLLPLNSGTGLVGHKPLLAVTFRVYDGIVGPPPATGDGSGCVRFVASPSKVI